MTATVGDWLDLLEERFPASWAEPWDQVGLQVGDRGWAADRAMVALDPTSGVVAEARDRGCGLLVAHHPMLLHGLDRLNLGDPLARAAAEALGSRVAVTAVHTSADVAPNGVTDALAEALGLEVTGVLRTTEGSGRVKLVTFVPAEATSKVLDAVAGAGAGTIGEYRHCSFRVRGTATFLPSERATPTIGERGRLTEAEEDRLEVVVPRDRLGAVVESMIEAHPYEEVAYDVYPLAGAGGLGLGRLAHPSEPTTPWSLAERCRERLGARLRVAGPADAPVREVALCGGSGASLIPDAVRAGADALVTGDVKHHDALDATSAGLAVIDPGHHATEWPFVPRLAGWLGDSGLGEALIAETPTDPFGWP